jgi:hypothetical protein
MIEQKFHPSQNNVSILMYQFSSTDNDNLAYIVFHIPSSSF